MGTHPIFESDFDCLTDKVLFMRKKMNEKLSFNRNAETRAINGQHEQPASISWENGHDVLPRYSRATRGRL